MPGGQFLELLLLKWSDFDNSKIGSVKNFVLLSCNLSMFTADGI